MGKFVKSANIKTLLFNGLVALLILMTPLMNSFIHIPTTYPFLKTEASSSIASPFTDEYGYYSLATSGNSISNYLSSIPIEFSYDDGYILLKAPYLIYTSEAERYYYGSVVDTKEGSSTLDPVDTWALTYNDQPYINPVGGISIQCYRGDTYINEASYSLSGNSACTSSKYYLQNLSISFSIPNNITSIKLVFNTVTYTSTYHEVVDVNDIETEIPEDIYNSYMSTKTGSTKNRYIDASFTFSITEGYSIIGYGIEDQRGTISDYTIRRYNYESGTVTFRINFVAGSSTNYYGYRAYATMRKPPYMVYDKTITTTYIDRGTPSSINNVQTSNLYWFPSFFLATINCSGRGDQEDKEMVINNWDAVATHFLLLPSEYQEAFTSGTLSDPRCLEALIRYDYVVFYKNYGLDDFASRSNKTNRYYLNNTNKVKTIFTNDDNDYLLIIVLSLTMIISLSTLTILLIRKKNQQE